MCNVENYDASDGLAASMNCFLVACCATRPNLVACSVLLKQSNMLICNVCFLQYNLNAYAARNGLRKRKQICGSISYWSSMWTQNNRANTTGATLGDHDPG